MLGCIQALYRGQIKQLFKGIYETEGHSKQCQSMLRQPYQLWIALVCLAVLLSACTIALKPAVENAPKLRGVVSSPADKPFLGIGFEVVDLSQYTEGQPQWGYRVLLLLPKTAAAVAGLKRGDYLLSFDQQRLDDMPAKMRVKALKDYVEKQHVGDVVQLEVMRKVSRVKFTDDLGNRRWRAVADADLTALLQHSGTAVKHRVDIRHEWQHWTLPVTLGTRPNLVATLPPNHTLAISDTVGETQVTQLAEHLLATHQLLERQRQLFGVFDESERWDDGRRLRNFRYLHRNPHRALPLVTQLTARLQAPARQQDWPALLMAATEWHGISVRAPQPIVHPTSMHLEDHKLAIQQVLQQAYTLQMRGLAGLNEQQLEQLATALPALLERFSRSLYIDHGMEGDDTINHELLQQLDRIDLVALHQAAMTLLWFTDRAWLEHLRQASSNEASNHTDKDNSRVAVFNSVAGPVVIGGPGNNVYRNRGAVWIDLGGDDTYAVQTTGTNGPIQVIIDLAGDDNYAATDYHKLAAAWLGASLLFDVRGDDRYQSTHFGQASAVGGVAMLIDAQGDDRYYAAQFAQGFGLFGSALLVDGAGNDHYQGQQYMQGVGAPRGFGALIDLSGNDTYHSSGGTTSSYGRHGIFKGLGQGLGVGFRGYASGGIGVLLDVAGNDHYQAGNFAQGTGYFYGLGVLRDRQGNDEYFASRYGQAAAAHAAGGVLIDDAGDDRYQGWHAALQSAAWDDSFTAFWDRQGNDYYGHVPNSFSIGAVAHNSFSLFVDERGDDYYAGIHRAKAKTDEYDLQLFFDLGGKDTYRHSSDYGNNQNIATPTGFFYDVE